MTHMSCVSITLLRLHGVQVAYHGQHEQRRGSCALRRAQRQLAAIRPFDLKTRLSRKRETHETDAANWPPTG
jgi:hypothetical protein